MLSQYILVINTTNQVWARLTDDRVARDDRGRRCISLTIQGKCDLKALSSEKMIYKFIDYSHVIRVQVRKISFGLETIDD